MGMPTNVVRLSFDLPFVGALTIWPFVFASWSTWNDPSWQYALRHEQVHLIQQHAWYARAWLFGLLAWFVCYELLLPIDRKSVV